MRAIREGSNLTSLAFLESQRDVEETREQIIVQKLTQFDLKDLQGWLDKIIGNFPFGFFFQILNILI